MSYATTIGSRRYGFADLRTLMAKASPLRSGDQLAGLAAASHAPFLLNHVAIHVAGSAWIILAALVLAFRHQRLPTADATHLVPVVAVAPAGVVKRRRDVLVRWSKTWMEGARDLSADPASAARQLAAQKGAPEAVDLIDALGWLRFTDLQGAAEAAGLSGRSAVNLDALFHRTWDLWRDVGLLTTPPPERVPLNATIIADLAHEATTTTSKPRRPADGGEAETLLVHTVPGRRLKAEAEAALVSEVGFLAGVFSRSTVEVWIPRSPDAAQRVAHHATDRFGLAEGRVVVRTTRETKAGSAAVVTVHAAR